MKNIFECLLCFTSVLLQLLAALHMSLLLKGAQVVALHFIFALRKNAAVFRQQIKSFAHHYSIVTLLCSLKILNESPHMWTSFFSETTSCKKIILCFYTHQVPISLNIKEKIKMHALQEFGS